MANNLLRKWLHENLNVEVYRIKTSTSPFGIHHDKGTIILDESTDLLYLALDRIYPSSYITELLANNKIKLIFVSRFIDLFDTPVASTPEIYSGYENMRVTVNNSGDGLIFESPTPTVGLITSYKFNTILTAPAASIDGYFNYDDIIAGTITTIYISDTDINGISQSSTFELMNIGDMINMENLSSVGFNKFRITTKPEFNVGGWYVIKVELLDSNISFSDDDTIKVGWVSGSSGLEYFEDGVTSSVNGWKLIANPSTSTGLHAVNLMATGDATQPNLVYFHGTAFAKLASDLPSSVGTGATWSALPKGTLWYNNTLSNFRIVTSEETAEGAGDIVIENLIPDSDNYNKWTFTANSTSKEILSDVYLKFVEGTDIEIATASGGITGTGTAIDPYIVDIKHAVYSTSSGDIEAGRYVSAISVTNNGHSTSNSYEYVYIATAHDVEYIDVPNKDEEGDVVEGLIEGNILQFNGTKWNNSNYRLIPIILPTMAVGDVGTMMSDIDDSNLPKYWTGTEWLYLITDTNDIDLSHVLFDNVVESYTKQQYFVASVESQSTTLAWDLDDKQAEILTLTGDVTITPSNMKAGASYTLILKQDSTGSRNVTWASTFKWEDGIEPPITLNANAVDVLAFVSDGTNLYGTIIPNYL